MASDVQIANAALMKLGHEPIVSFNDESDQARAVNAVYDICRDDVLSAHDWNFATKHVQLAEVVQTVATDEYAHFYQLPSDYIRILYVEPIGEKFAVRDGQIYTDASSPIKVAYIARVTDSGRFSANFVGAFVYRLCAELVTALTARDGYQRDFWGLYAGKIQEAKSTDGLEGSGVVEDDNPLGLARLTSGSFGVDHSGWPWG